MIAVLRRCAVVAVALVGLALPLATRSGEAAPASAHDVLVLGRISDDPKTNYDQLKPLLDYVVPRMASVGIREGRVLMARDAQQMASYLRRGRVDWVTETAATAVLLQQRAGAQPLLLTERDGRSSYHSVFFARRDSGLRSLDDLHGQSVAFQRPSSTSAYFVPATTLLERGYRLEVLLSPTDRMESDAVGYVFARSELNVATWVHKRLVDVGVLSDVDWVSRQRVPDAFRRDLVVIGRSGDVPRALELVRADLDPRVAARLKEVLESAARDPRAAPALARFFGTTRFLPLDDASQRSLRHLAAGVMRVRAEVE